MTVVTTSAALSSRSESTPFWVLGFKFLLWLFAWITTAFYAMVWIIMPTKHGEIFYHHIDHKMMMMKPFGWAAEYYLLFTLPIVVLALVACAIIGLEKAYPSRRSARKGQSGWLRRAYDNLWQPLVVKSPMGMMSAIEMLGFATVVVVTSWHFFAYLLRRFKEFDSAEVDPLYTKKELKLEYLSLIFGWAAMVPLSLLFLPVSRGSPILKLIDIPFEHAVKYHVWIGHFTMILLTLHGVFYGIFYGIRDEAYLFVKWQRNDIANTPGVIAVAAGLLMWPTSLAWMRRRHFNLFFNVHQLYLVFFAFAAWHLGVGLTVMFLGGPFLFFVDRFLRLLQSRRAVKGLKARVLPTGIVELKLPVSPGGYNPLSFMFLNMGGLESLQWHPFSTSSSPLDGTNYMSILIKPLGDWTDKLRKSIDATSGPQASQCPFGLGKLYAEGPYGHESNYFLKYEHLLLVAGGIGVTPFLAITSDILLRYQSGEVGLPTTVDLIWCVKRRAELIAYKDIFQELSRIYTNCGKSRGSELQLNVKVFLTGERAAGGPGNVSSLSAAMEVPVQASDVAIELQDQKITTGRAAPVDMTPYDGERGRANDSGAESAWPGVDRSGSGSNLGLLAGVIVVSSVALVLLFAFFRMYVYYPNTALDLDTHEGTELPGWLEVLLFLVALLVAIVGFGGLFVFGYKLASKRSKKSNSAHIGQELDSDGGKHPIQHVEESILEHSTIVFGMRPNFTEVMDEVRAQHSADGAEVGVMVCGPETLAETVATQCRSQSFKNMLSTKGKTTQFQYHSVSFDL